MNLLNSRKRKGKERATGGETINNITYDDENPIHRYFKNMEEMQSRNEIIKKESIESFKSHGLDPPIHDKEIEDVEKVSDLMQMDEFTKNCNDLIKCSQLLYTDEPCERLVFIPRGTMDASGKAIYDKDVVDCDAEGNFTCPRWIDYIYNKIRYERKRKEATS